MHGGRGGQHLTGIDYHYEEGRYVGGSRDGQLAYRAFTGVTASYCGGFGFFTAGVGSPSVGTVRPSHDRYDAIVVAAWRRRRIDGVMINYSLVEPKEQIWLGYSPTDIQFQRTVSRLVGESGRNRVQQPLSGYVIIIHTHPTWAEATPGAGDFGHPVPVYGLTPNGVWVIRVGSSIAEHLPRRLGRWQ